MCDFALKLVLENCPRPLPYRVLMRLRTLSKAWCEYLDANTPSNPWRRLKKLVEFDRFGPLRAMQYAVVVQEDQRHSPMYERDASLVLSYRGTLPKRFPLTRHELRALSEHLQRVGYRTIMLYCEINSLELEMIIDDSRALQVYWNALSGIVRVTRRNSSLQRDSIERTILAFFAHASECLGRATLTEFTLPATGHFSLRFMCEFDFDALVRYLRATDVCWRPCGGRATFVRQIDADSTSFRTKRHELTLYEHGEVEIDNVADRSKAIDEVRAHIARLSAAAANKHSTHDASTIWLAS